MLEFSLVCRCGEPVVDAQVPDRLVALRTLVGRGNMRFPTLASSNLPRLWPEYEHCKRGGGDTSRVSGRSLFIRYTQCLISIVKRVFVPHAMVSLEVNHDRQQPPWTKRI